MVYWVVAVKSDENASKVKVRFVFGTPFLNFACTEQFSLEYNQFVGRSGTRLQSTELKGVNLHIVRKINLTYLWKSRAGGKPQMRREC